MGLIVFVYHHYKSFVLDHRRDENETKMNAVVSTRKTSYQSVGRDEESATLMSRDEENVSTTSKKSSSSSSSNGVSLKTVAYGLGVVALACSGSFVAGRSAARYKLAQTGMGVVQSTTTTSPSHIPRLGNKQHHSTAHSMAAAKKKKMSSDDASSSPKEEEEEEEEAKKTTEDEPADPETMTKEEMAEEIKQLRGYMTTLAETAEDEKHHHSKKASKSSKEETPEESEEEDPEDTQQPAGEEE